MTFILASPFFSLYQMCFVRWYAVTASCAENFFRSVADSFKSLIRCSLGLGKKIKF